MGNEQQSNKAEENSQPIGRSASCGAELTSACAAKSSQAEGTAGKGADQSADNKVGSDQANTESAASSDQPLPSDQSEVSALKASLAQAIGELAAGKGAKTEVNELKAALAQAIGKLESIVDQSDETQAAEDKAAEAPNSDEAVASADQASAPSADEPLAAKKAEAQASGGGSADATPAADSQSEDEPHRCSSFFSWIGSQLSAFRVFAHAGKDNTERLLKYTERIVTGIVGVLFSLGVYFATTEHTFADWQFQGAIVAAAMFGAMLAVMYIYSANLLMRLDVLAQNDSAAHADKMAAESDLSAGMLEKAKAETEALKLLIAVLKDVMGSVKLQDADWFYTHLR